MNILLATSTGKKINVPGSIKLPEVSCEKNLSQRLVSWSVVSILIHDYLDMTENMLSNLLDVNYFTNILLKHELYQVYQPIFGILIIYSIVLTLFRKRRRLKKSIGGIETITGSFLSLAALLRCIVVAYFFFNFLFKRTSVYKFIFGCLGQQLMEKSSGPLGGR